MHELCVGIMVGVNEKSRSPKGKNRLTGIGNILLLAHTILQHLS